MEEIDFKEIIDDYFGNPFGLEDWYNMSKEDLIQLMKIAIIKYKQLEI